MKVSFLTLGCKVNQAESLEWERAVLRQGHRVVSLDDNPDICVVNTCTVTGKSDYESRRLIRRAQRSGSQVMVTGCYSQLNAGFVSKMSGVINVIDNADKYNIINKIDAIAPFNPSLDSTSMVGSTRTRTRKFLKIQDGCEYSCTYCLVWKARGKSRSIPTENVIDQVKEAADDGFREIVLTGVHLGLYGKELGRGHSLSSLINAIISKSYVPHIRVSSLEVNEIDDGILDLIKGGHVCQHLHVPLQSGDNDVLKVMGRNYTREYYSEKLLKIYDCIGDMAIGTDIIAGFPTETAQAFQNTVSLVKNLPFTYLHVFPYSLRPGTKASGFPDIVGNVERKSRAAILRSMSARKKESFAKKQVGKTISMLVEEYFGDGTCIGTSDNYLKISAPLPLEAKGSIVPIHIERARKGQLFGNRTEAP